MDSRGVDKMVLGTTFMQRFEEYCPQWLAEERDPVGLQIGTLHKEIKRVMMTLDVRPEVVTEAIAKKVDLVIAKHPPIFRAIQTLTADDPQTKMYLDLAKHDIAVYAAHTNMDIIDDGLNDWFCEDLEILNTRYLTETHRLSRALITCHIPIVQQSHLIAKLTTRFYDLAGKIQISQDEHFMTLSVLTNQVSTIVNWLVKEGICSEQVDVKESTDEVTFGIGRVGTLATPKTLTEFSTQVKEAFDLDGLRIVPVCPERMIETVAICGGSGGSLYPKAVAAKADVYITGDIYYHTAHDMQAHGLAAIDPGHHIEERCILTFVEKMVEWKQVEGWDLEIIGSTTNTNPFYFN